MGAQFVCCQGRMKVIYDSITRLLSMHSRIFGQALPFLKLPGLPNEYTFSLRRITQYFFSLLKPMGNFATAKTVLVSERLTRLTISPGRAPMYTVEKQL